MTKTDFPETSERNFELERKMEIGLRNCGCKTGIPFPYQDSGIGINTGDGKSYKNRDSIMMTQVKCKENIFGEKDKPIDFLVYIPVHHRMPMSWLIAIECKWPPKTGIVGTTSFPSLSGSLPLSVDRSFTRIVLDDNCQLPDLENWKKEQNEKKQAIQVWTVEDTLFFLRQLTA